MKWEEQVLPLVREGVEGGGGRVYSKNDRKNSSTDGIFMPILILITCQVLV